MYKRQLWITDLDPIRYDLLFERFLNPERVSMPDFDIDFCQGNRDRVIEYVKDKYGRDAVSQIATFGTMASRAGGRDVGRGGRYAAQGPAPAGWGAIVGNRRPAWNPAGGMPGPAPGAGGRVGGPGGVWRGGSVADQWFVGSGWPNGFRCGLFNSSGGGWVVRFAPNKVNWRKMYHIWWRSAANRRQPSLSSTAGRGLVRGTFGPYARQPLQFRSDCRAGGIGCHVLAIDVRDSVEDEVGFVPMQLANLDGQYAAAAIHEDAHGKRQADAKRVGRCEPVFFADQQRIVHLGPVSYTHLTLPTSDLV